MSNIYGYIRVSTRAQHEDRQLIALQELNPPLVSLMSILTFHQDRIRM